MIAMVVLRRLPTAVLLAIGLAYYGSSGQPGGGWSVQTKDASPSGTLALPMKLRVKVASPDELTARVTAPAG